MKRCHVIMVAVVLVAGCNRRVFERVEPLCGPTDLKDITVADEAIDILLVVDNSGSMQEEQDDIARNFLNPDGSCPIPTDALADFRRCNDDDVTTRPAVCRFHDPSPEQLRGELATCGFLQILAAYDVDFRVGVITTDVGRCDNRIPERLGGAGRGFQPQRGCLQPDSPGGLRFIARDDVDSDDDAMRDLGGRFARTLARISTFGSPSERGLDAVDLFFADDALREEACADDRDDFIRDDARLALIFLTDEEDCSRIDENGPFACNASDTSCRPRFEEFANDVCGPDATAHTRGAGSACYDHPETLTPVEVYASRFAALKRTPQDVTVAVIAGGAFVDGNVAAFAAGGCTIGDDGEATSGCEPLAGRPRSECPDCCLADGGGRYVELAERLGGIRDSICAASFTDTLIDIAAFLGDRDVIRFGEVPSDVDLIVVQDDEGALVPRLDGDRCDERDGWLLENDGVGLRLCGDARPGPGETRRVRAPLSGRCAPSPFDDL